MRASPGLTAPLGVYARTLANDNVPFMDKEKAVLLGLVSLSQSAHRSGVGIVFRSATVWNRNRPALHLIGLFFVSPANLNTGVEPTARSFAGVPRLRANR